jgi:outer membrane protein OmpA-like peptidoglycan-associated protein
MTADSRHGRRVSLSEAELNAVLSAAGDELLDHVCAAAHPDAGLLAIMAACEGVKTTAESDDVARVPRGQQRRVSAWIGSLPVAVAIAVIAAIFVLRGVTPSQPAHHAKHGAPHSNVWHVNITAGPPNGLGGIYYIDSSGTVTASPLIQETAELEVGTVFFRPGKAILDKSADAELRRLLPTLLAADGSDIVVDGYADVGSASGDALNLSGERAEMVRKWLIAHRVSASAVSAVAYGFTRYDGDGPAKQRNRVTISFTPPGGQWEVFISNLRSTSISVTYQPITESGAEP